MTLPAPDAFPRWMPEIRSPKTGRIDARRVSDLFGIPMERLALSLKADAEALSEAPDAAALQEPLRLYERIAQALMGLVGLEEGLRVWLTMPEPDLDNEIPRELLLNGEGEVVAELLRDWQEGQPG